MNRIVLTSLLCVACSPPPSSKDDPGTTAPSGETGTTADTATLSDATVVVDDGTAPTVASTLSCDYAVDGDVTDLSVSWSVNGLDLSIDDDTLAAPSFQRDDEVRCTISGTSAAGTALSDTSDGLLIGNSPPPAPVVSLSLVDPPAGTGDIVCSVASSDPDPDGDDLLVTYAWTRNGTDFSATAETDTPGDTIPVGAAFEGDVFLCTATVTDGIDHVSDRESTTIGAPIERDGQLAPTALLDCDDLSRSGAVNADYYVHPGGEMSTPPELVPCIFDFYEHEWSYTGTAETFEVPDGVGYVTIYAWGGAGGSVQDTGCGGNVFEWGGAGAAVHATVPVSDTDTLTILVGRGGSDGSDRPGAETFSNIGYLGGGGPGAPLDATCGATGGASGAGFSGVFNGSVDQANTLAIAGGGGGAGSHGPGGGGGGPDGEVGGCRSGRICLPGDGGTTTAGGDNGHATTPRDCTTNGAATDGNGAPLYGGSGCWFGSAHTSVEGAGGGGGGGSGYFGGGGGSTTRSDYGAGGGGGGASYIHTDAIVAVIEGAVGNSVGGSSWSVYTNRAGQSSTGSRGGDGHVIIRY